MILGENDLASSSSCSKDARLESFLSIFTEACQLPCVDLEGEEKSEEK